MQNAAKLILLANLRSTSIDMYPTIAATAIATNAVGFNTIPIPSNNPKKISPARTEGIEIKKLILNIIFQDVSVKFFHVVMVVDI